MKEITNVSECKFKLNFSSAHILWNFSLLHSILILCTRYSIHDSQQNFIITESTVAACETEILKKYESKIQIQPVVLVIGSILESKEIVYFESIKY